MEVFCSALEGLISLHSKILQGPEYWTECVEPGKPNILISSLKCKLIQLGFFVLVLWFFGFFLSHDIDYLRYKA